MRNLFANKSVQTALSFLLIFAVSVGAAVGLTRLTENRRWYAHETAEQVVWLSDGGATHKAPDHTSAAFVRAGQSGAYGGIMGTVQMSKDGVPVMLREDTVNRMTDQKGKVQKFTYAELLQMKVDNGNGTGLYAGVQITALKDFLRICRNYNLSPVLQLGRGAEPEAVLGLLEEFGLTEKAFIVSENRRALLSLREQNAKIGLFYKVDAISASDTKFCAENGFVLFFRAENAKNTNKAIWKAKSAGAVLGVWSKNGKTDGTRFTENRVTYIAAKMPQTEG